MVGFAHPKLMAFNRNAIYNDSDGSPFKPDTPPHNVHKKAAFDPSVVPEPSYDGIPFKLKLVFLPVLLNPFARPKLKDKALFPDVADSEVVEITWE